MTRDQERARHAYECVKEVTGDDRKDYKVAVNDLGTNILRSGLAAAMAGLERQQKRDAVAVQALLRHLAAAQVRGLGQGDGLPDRVRQLGLSEYQLATREMLKVATWFKRAVQATMEDDDA